MTASKVWIYQADRFLSDQEVAAIQAEADRFLAGWKAHGQDLYAELEIRHRLFLILKVDERFQQATGCSIDKSVDFFKQLEETFGLELFDRHRFAYEYEGQLFYDRLPNLNNLVQHGYITDDTLVYNYLAGSLEELKQQFRMPFGQSWHRKLVSPAALQG